MKQPDSEQLTELADKLLKGTITPEERKLFYKWYNEGTNAPISWEGPDQSPEELSSRLLTSIQGRKATYQLKRKFNWKLSSAAILIITLASASLYYTYHIKPNKQQFAGTKNITDHHTATLTLSDGTKVDISNTGDQTFTEPSGIRISKSKKGQLIYNLSNMGIKAGKNKSNLYNTVATPIGSQYQVILPDGTKVWLNALSSLKYPLRFHNGQRIVSLTGEGYFEVAHQKNSTFKVHSAGQIIEVLGTHFNVNAYSDEPSTKTTLLEGLILIQNKENIKKVLVPGQQASLSADGIQVLNFDTELAVAWKNGDFAFEDMPLSIVMRQISRWYDVEVIYQGNTSGIKIGGSISRTKSLEEVLRILEITQLVHFKTEGRRILVMP